jgi:hypothetical protein
LLLIPLKGENRKGNMSLLTQVNNRVGGGGRHQLQYPFGFALAGLMAVFVLGIVLTGVITAGQAFCAAMPFRLYCIAADMTGVLEKIPFF